MFSTKKLTNRNKAKFTNFKPDLEKTLKESLLNCLLKPLILRYSIKRINSLPEISFRNDQASGYKFRPRHRFPSRKS